MYNCENIGASALPHPKSRLQIHGKVEFFALLINTYANQASSNLKPETRNLKLETLNLELEIRDLDS